MPPTMESNLHQDLRPLQAVNNCTGRSEQGKVEVVGKEFKCLRCEVYAPDPAPGSSAYNYLSHLARFFNQRDLRTTRKIGLEVGGKRGALPPQLPTPRFGG